MQYILIAILIMVMCAFGFSCRRNPSTTYPGKTSGKIVTQSSGHYMTTEAIQNQLEKIAKKPPPKNLAMGAMCYEVVGPPQRIDYVCPVCGEKTLYVLETTADGQINSQQWKKIGTVQALESLRRLTQQINKLEVTLDESQFCSHCSPDIDEPKVGLVVQYPDNPQPHCVWEINGQDLLILHAFSQGQLKFADATGFEHPLKDSLPRLEELLGIELDDAE